MRLKDLKPGLYRFNSKEFYHYGVRIYFYKTSEEAAKQMNSIARIQVPPGKESIDWIWYVTEVCKQFDYKIVQVISDRACGWVLLSHDHSLVKL